MAATPQQLVAGAACFDCIDNPMRVPAELYLLDQMRVADGGAAMTTQQLVDAAKCFVCIPNNMRVPSALYLLGQTASLI